MTTAGRLVLASASPRRATLLSDAGWAFDVRPAELDEDALLEGLEPETGALRVARAKAECVVARPTDVVLAADTIVVAADGGVLGKPTDAREAEAHLRRLSGTTHRVITGVALLHRDRWRGQWVATRVTMRRLAEREVAAYVASGEGLGKAGGYAIQESGDRFVTRVDGSWTNVVGLPMELVNGWLEAVGLSRARAERGS